MERLLNSAEEDLIKKIEDVNARLAKIENQLCQILAEKAVNPLTEGK